MNITDGKIFWIVYLLRCNDGKIYTGCTSDIFKRLKSHRKGKVKFTSTRLPVEVIGYFAFDDRRRAFRFEKYLKSGSGIAFRNKRLMS